MPNVLDVEPVRQAARRIASKIANPMVAARFEKLAYDRLLADPRNFREASAAEISDSPAWAQDAASRGEIVSVFKLNRGASMRLHNLARRLIEVCALATAQAPSHGQGRYVLAAREFIDKIERASFEVMARKAMSLSRIYAGWSEVSEVLCAADIVAATQGRAWTRITSLAELRGIGREMTNCLARTSETSAYGGHLKDGRAQFWVLRDARGVALMAAMAPTAAPADFREVKGPRNTPVSRTNADLLCLAKAILVGGDRPPPPEPPTPAPASLTMMPMYFGRPHGGAPSISAPIFALDSQEEIARLRFASTDVVITRRRRRAS